MAEEQNACKRCGKKWKPPSVSSLADPQCDACNGSGISYWSDGISGSCMECVGVDGGYKPLCDICSQATPRINGKMINQYQKLSDTYPEISIAGKYVETLECKPSEFNDQLIISCEASDGIKFKVIVPENWKGYKSQFIEIKGSLMDGSVWQNTYTELGNNFDLKIWDQFVKLTHQYPQLF
eukprot:529825_1